MTLKNTAGTERCRKYDPGRVLDSVLGKVLQIFTDDTERSHSVFIFLFTQNPWQSTESRFKLLTSLPLRLRRSKDTGRGATVEPVLDKIWAKSTAFVPPTTQMRRLNPHCDASHWDGSAFFSFFFIRNQKTIEIIKYLKKKKKEKVCEH